MGAVPGRGPQAIVGCAMGHPPLVLASLVRALRGVPQDLETGAGVAAERTT